MASTANDTCLRLLHHHIFKNAGTSFVLALRKYFGDQLAEYDGDQASSFVDAGKLREFWRGRPEILAVSSHQAELLTSEQAVYPGGRIFQTLLLRDPLARIPSMYHFERQQDAASPGARKAKELDLAGYIRWRLETTPTAILNYQVAYCARTQKFGTRLMSECDLATARERLAGIDAVGKVEEYAVFLRACEERLKPFFPGLELTATHANRSGSATSSPRQQLREAIGDDLLETLEAGNQLDYALWRSF